MVRIIAYVSLILSALILVAGYASLTCYGYFPVNQFNWWVFGCSTYVASCCLMAIVFGMFEMSRFSRVLFWVSVCTFLAALILTGTYFRGSFLGRGPRRVYDHYQLASLTPLFITSLAFVPLLLQSYRRVYVSRTNQLQVPNRKQFLVEVGLVLALFLVSYLVPSLSDLWIGHTMGDRSYFVIYSTICIVAGTLLLLPLTGMFLSPKPFSGVLLSILSSVGLCGGLVVQVLWFSGNRFVDEIFWDTLAIAGGPIMLLLALWGLRCLGWRIQIPSFRTLWSSKESKPKTHPLDSVAPVS